MRLVMIHRGSQGKIVAKWQAFLRGFDLYQGQIDREFGPQTEKATLQFQRANGLPRVDGIVAGWTWGKALMLGLDGCKIKTDDRNINELNWPPPREGLRRLGVRGRQKMFGSFEFESCPSFGCPEEIKVLGQDEKFKLVKLKLPAFGSSQCRMPSEIMFHVLAVEQLRSLFAAWENAGLNKNVLSWGGSYFPRFVRGSRRRLSSHAWGTAFDINAAWNGLARTPAYVDETGSVRELVELAQDHGFYWGGHFRRPDGMHFECVKLL